MGKEDISFVAYEARLNPKIAQIIRQYRAVAGLYDRFWQEVSLRSTNSSWRLDDQKIGSCNASRYTSEGGISGPAKSHLIMLRELRNTEAGGLPIEGACPYHRPEKGCVLGDLKSPKCLDHVDLFHGQEMRGRFGLSPVGMYFPLAHILLGGINPSKRFSRSDPYKNEGHVQSLIAITLREITHIRTFPILHPEELSPTLSKDFCYSNL